MKTESLMIYSIPSIFILGIIAFFVLIPSGSITVNIFISYVASLSTVIMVLVYIFTTSRQLGVMRHQLDEIQYSRNVQVQPLIDIKDVTINLEAPRYYASPENEFK
ncbi:hypothetical protein ACFLQ6_11050, partial [Thermoproteota archaeon]